ncbi:cell division protein FtsK [Streptococcus mitis]|uniref:FtsK/SpoIIIE domain-containing protein n=1 Tax=Streptococcus mitis TaxID=28037 RepID=UPI0021B81CA3|nr:FtsK/SpoIIIE domain-containing protein [Streptococcus mitis]MCY7164352.1 cell division protein FtsK [Streptococcus mitis]
MIKVNNSVSLMNSYILTTKRVRSLHIFVLLSSFLALISITSILNLFFLRILILSFGLFLIYRLNIYLKCLIDLVRPSLIVRECILFVIERQGLYKSSEGIVLSSATLEYYFKNGYIFVNAILCGDEYVDKLCDIGLYLGTSLGITLESQELFPTCMQYKFRYIVPERLHIASLLPLEDDSLKIKIYDNFVIDLRKNFSMLISGASGAGKSFFTYYYLTRFIAQTVNGKHAKIYVIDPKMSDIYKLCKLSGLPVGNYGTTNEDAFRILRQYIKELDRRMLIYNQSDLFDSIGIDLGLPPLLLLIEEYSSLVASMDSKAKKDFENMVAIVAQKARSLSMGVCIVMQQPRSDSLSTNIREQLVNAIFLGSHPSKECSNMMFGTADVPNVKKDKGVGLYSIEREPPKEFQAPIFDRDVFETILPVWECAAKDYKKDEECVK